jgi:colanic acid/amylovoran biosynthesis glycosyltransferase
VRYQPTVITRSLVDEAQSALPVCALDGRRNTLPARVRRALYSLTAGPGLFGGGNPFPTVGLLHAHFGPDGTYALPLAAALRVPLITTFHGWDVTVRPSAMLASPNPTIARYLLRRGALRRSGGAFIAVSDYVRDRLLVLGFAPERVIRHYIGVDTRRFTPIPDEARTSERYILSVARHAAKKGLDTLLRAFARVAPRFPDVRLVQVGNGPLTPELKALAAALGIASRVEFAGAQPYDRVRELMQNATAVALTSQTAADGDEEALGMVLNEASACAVPIVATRHGGIPEAVLDKQTGLLAPERDVNAIGDALAGLLQDPEYARQLGRRGREFVCEAFDIRTQTAALERIYDDVIAAARG